jgi:hypothetical protein
VQSVQDAKELTYMLGELYALKRRDSQLIEQLTTQRAEFELRISELELELQALTDKEAGKDV